MFYLRKLSFGCIALLLWSMAAMLSCKDHKEWVSPNRTPERLMKAGVPKAPELPQVQVKPVAAQQKGKATSDKSRWLAQATPPQPTEKAEQEAQKLADEANTLMGRHDISGARRVINRLLSRYAFTQGAASAYYNWGTYLHRQGKKTEAINVFSSFARRFPKSNLVASASSMLQTVSGEYIYMYLGRSFAEGENINVNISSRGVKQLELQIWEVDLFSYVQQGNNPQQISLGLLPRGKLLKQWQKEPKYPRHRIFARRHHYSHYANTPVTLPAMKAGTYLFLVNGKYTHSGGVLLVNRYGMIVKRSSERLLAFVAHRNKPEIATQAQVSVFDTNGKILASGKTDAKGVFVAPIKRELGNNTYVLARVGEETIISHSYFWHSQPQNKMAMIYTDRPVYRPNQTVSYKVIARTRHLEAQGERYSSNAGEEVEVLVRDARGNQVDKRKLKTGDFGTVDAQIQLGGSASIGRYNIHTNYGGQSFHGYFHVEAYKKPEYMVEVQPSRTYVVGGESIKATISARYYFGQPVTDAEVKYTVHRATRYHSPFFSGRHSWYYNPHVHHGSGYRGSFVSQGSGKLNSQGQLVVTIPTQKVENDFVYTISAQVIDKSRRHIEASATFSVTRAAFALRIQTDRYAYRPGDQVVTTVHATGHDGTPVQTKVDLQVIVYQYDRSRGWQRSERVLYKKQLQTNAQGQAIYTWTPDLEGYLTIRAEAVDTRGNRVETSQWLWYISPHYSSYYSHSSSGNIILDKDTYAVGDQANIILTMGQGERYVLLTYEADDIISYDVIQFKGTTRMLQREITLRDVPNVMLTMTAIANSSFFQQQKQIVVPPVQRFLEVKIAPHKAHYEPGDMATIDIAITDTQQRPVVAELSLGVVDESIFAIRPDHTQDIRKVFYGIRPVRVSTYHSLHFYTQTRGVRADMPASETSARPSVAMRSRRMAAPPPAGMAADDSASSGPLVEARVRKDFADTALWSPTVVTDAQGRARITMKMPDNLTTWRFVARAVTRDTLVGWQKNTVLVKKDLLVRLQTPRSLTEGDIVTISGIVHNYLPRPKKVFVDLHVEGLRFLKKTPLKYAITVPPSGEQRLDFRLRAIGPRQSVVRIRARTDEQSDAMELKIPMLPFGAKQTYVTSGKMDDDQVSLSVEVPATAAKQSSSLKLSLSPSLAVAMLDSLEYLVGYPYGCVEQTMSRLLPNLYVAQTLQQLGITHPKLKAELPKMIKQGVERLYDMQQSHGGWGWWSHGEADPFMTAYALYGLMMARHADYEIDSSRIERAVAQLRQLIKNPKQQPDAIAYMAYILSFHSKLPDDLLKQIYDLRSKMGDYGKALTFMSLHRAGKNTYARHIIANLEDTPKVSANSAYWDGNTWRYSWTDNKIETTAFVLQALVMHNPKHPLIPKAIQYLMSVRQGNRWTSTKDTAAVVYAFAYYLKASGELSAQYDFEVLLNQKLIHSGSVNPSNIANFKGTIEITGEHLKTGINNIILRKRGKGSLYHSTFLTYYNRAKQLKPTSSGITIARQYYVLSDKDPKSGVSKRTPYKGQILRSGQELEVELKTNIPQAYQYFMLEDFIPAGAEIVKGETPGQHGSPYHHPRWRHHHVVRNYHSEARDDRMVFFQSSLGSGEHTFTYRLRAEIPGRFNVLPAYAELMYKPEITGTSDNTFVRIAD